MNELKEITKVDKELLDKIENILGSELSCEEYDIFYNYFNEIRKPSILIDIKDDENIKELITNLQSKINEAIEYINKEYDTEPHELYGLVSADELLNILNDDKYQEIPQFKGTMEQLDELCDIRKEDK